jgi:hypothetical protein
MNYLFQKERVVSVPMVGFKIHTDTSKGRRQISLKVKRNCKWLKLSICLIKYHAREP